MKRFSVWLALVAVALMVCAPLAEAGTWQRREVGWTVTNSTVLNNAQTAGVAVTYKSGRGLGGNIDTTAAFSLTGVQFPASFGSVSTTVDTAIVAYLQFTTDSTVSVSQTLSSVTFTVEGSSDGINWSTAISSQVRTPVSGDVAWTIPIWINQQIGANVGKGITHPWLTFPLYRVRITASTGSFAAAHCWLAYWGDPMQNDKKAPF